MFRVFCDESSLDPLDITNLVNSLNISHLQLSSRYYRYDPYPMSQFHVMPGQPYRHTLKKGSLSPPYSPSLIPPFSVSVPRLSHTFDYPPRASCQGNIIALISCRSPSVDINTYIPDYRPRGPCILVSFTLLMRSLDHVRGVISASWGGCVSCARLQLHHRTIEVRTGFGSCSIWSPNVT